LRKVSVDHILRKSMLAVTIVLFVGAFICAYSLSTYTIIDEREYATQAFQAYWRGRIPRIYPLLPLLSSAFLAICGVTKTAFILTPFLGGLLSILFTYKLSKEVFEDEGKAILGSWLVACNPLLIWLSARHMTETLFTSMLVLTMLLLCRKSRSMGLSLSTGFSSLLAYLSRYAGILLFPYVAGAYLVKRRSLKAILPFSLSVVLLILYWIFNMMTFGVPLTTEFYSFSFLQGQAGFLSTFPSSQLLGNILSKSIVGCALLLGYSLPFFRSVKIGSLSDRGKLILCFALLYSLIHVGYYVILSINNGSAWSADHLGRYLLPVTPVFLVLLTSPSSNRRINLMLLALSMIVGISLGLYLAHYSSHHSENPVSWSDFLQRLASSP